MAPGGVARPPLGRALSRALFAAAIAFVAATPARAGQAGTLQSLPRPDVLLRALSAFHRVESLGVVHNRLLTVIDYSLPSSLRRLWVIDPDSLRVIAHEFVAHGRGSGDSEDPARAVRFGNDPESHRTSLGTFLTGGTYTGKHGHSLELEGLDPGLNDLARARRIVIHPAEYVGEAFRARTGGWVGRSFGCPALDPKVADDVIDRIQDGSVLFADAADPGD